MKANSADQPSTVDRAVMFIRESIVDGTFPAESMLSEADLAAELRVSRTPVRVALARLQDEGWVRIYPKRGALVKGLTPDELVDLSHARYVLESSGVLLAPSDRRARLADELTPLIDEQRSAFASGDIDRFIGLTLDFHGAFLRVGSNRYLIDLGERISDRQRWMLFANRDSLLERSSHIIDEHQQLLDCLRDDDPDRFAAILREHISDHDGRGFGSP